MLTCSANSQSLLVGKWSAQVLASACSTHSSNCGRSCFTCVPAANRAKPEEYTALIKAQDTAGLMDLLTDVEVEQMVIERVRLKAATFGQDINPGLQQRQAAGRFKIQPDVLASMYDEMIMPLTKEVQVEYLLHRLDHNDGDQQQ
eukprot:GHRR01024620.1.p2 GENE.GHRR01024620.1~~GHRR01024620.1.p2  ORF type:complete len:145 (+),score=40.43 GHRR01024620.1:108-542(+)